MFQIIHVLLDVSWAPIKARDGRCWSPKILAATDGTEIVTSTLACMNTGTTTIIDTIIKINK